MQNTKPAPHEQILSIVLGFWQARALAVATELGVPDLLAEGPLHVDELASRTKTNASALFRLVACSRKHRDLHPDLTARLRQYTDQRVPAQRCTRFAVAFGPPKSLQRQRTL